MPSAAITISAVRPEEAPMGTVTLWWIAIILAVVTSAATGLVLSPDWQFILKGVAVFLAIVAQTWALARRHR